MALPDTDTFFTALDGTPRVEVRGGEVMDLAACQAEADRWCGIVRRLSPARAQRAIPMANLYVERAQHLRRLGA